MPENKPFVINDRRKFTSEGELRDESAPDSSPKAPAGENAPEPESRRSENVHPFETRDAVSTVSGSRSEGYNSEASEAAEPRPARAGEAQGLDDAEDAQDQLPPPPTPEEIAQVTRAYESTVERLETAMRATNPGGERLPPMSFERFVQSLYMQALLQLGSLPEPGQPPQLDLIGARQTVDMLAILAGKTQGNLSDDEQKLLDSALFELRMGFLEVTQALARQAAAARQPNAGPGSPGGPRMPGPSIVR